MEPKTPIMLITGSLGSGKTTLLKKILDKSGRRIAVLMNEFGELAIDSQVIRGESIEIVEIAGGCVCCSMTGEFEAAIREIVDRFHPDMIVVEATGVAEADSLVFEVEESLPEVRLDSVVCLVDAYVSVKHPYVGYTTRTQLEAADIILVNKADLVSEEEMQEVEKQVRRFNDTAVIFKTVGADVDIDLLFGFEAERKASHAPHHHGREFSSFTYATQARLDEDRFMDFVSNLPQAVYRAKGFVRFNGQGHLFNYVVGRADLEDFDADKTELVFIGPGIDALKDNILDELKHCEV